MPFNMSTLISNQCLVIELEGTFDPGYEEQLAKGIYACQSSHTNLPTLLDIRKIEHNPSVFSDYQDVKQLIEAGIRKLGKMAILDKPERGEANSFFETVAINRGVNICFFYVKENALDWLTTEYKPNYEIKPDHEKKVLWIIGSGSFDKQSTTKMVSTARKMASELKFPLLYDLRLAKFQLSVIDLYQIPRDREIFADISTRVRKSANVFAKDVDKELLNFYETTARNSGLIWKAFFDVSEAMKWLSD